MKKTMITTYLEPRQIKVLDTISNETRVSKAELIRQAIDLWLRHVDKHPAKFGGAP